MNAVITAGGRVDGEFARTIGQSVKALAPCRDTTLLDLTIRAALAAGAVNVAVVGGEEVRRAVAPLVRVIDEDASGSENLRRALHAWDDDAPLLYLTSDMPFITGNALRAFIEASPGGTIALPLTEWDEFTRRFPDAPPFGITLAGEKVVNGGAFILPAGSCGAIEAFAARFFEARKSPLRMAQLTGAALLLKFLFRRLSVGALEAHAERLLGIPAKAVRNSPAELAYDVDVLEEYTYAISRT